MSKTHVAVWLRISPFYDMLLHTGNYSEPHLQNATHFGGVAYPPNKISKQSKKCKHFIPFFEILLGSEQLHTL